MSSPDRQLALEEALLLHAVRVKRDAYWLDFCDLLLFATHCGVDLKVICNDGSLSSVCAQEHVVNLTGLAPGVVEKLFGARKQATWHVLLTSADFRPSTHTCQMNHWAPARHADPVCSVDALCLASDGTIQCYDDYMNEMEEALLASLQEEKDRFQRFNEISKSMVELHGLQPIEVTGDGNCGCYALHQLMTDFPAAQPHELASSEVRATLSQLWRTASQDLGWQKVWTLACQAFFILFHCGISRKQSFQFAVLVHFISWQCLS